MKQLIFLFFTVCFFSPVMSQLKPKAKCGEFIVDILDGTVNGIKSNTNPEEIKLKLPCFTSTEEENAGSKCGGGVFFKDKEVYFFSGRDYVEIREKFQGKLTLPLMGAKRNSLFKWLGNPKIKDTSWDAYQVQYGTLVLHYNSAGKVRLIQFSTKSSEGLSLCE